jgi:hypothetical protein
MYSLAQNANRFLRPTAQAAAKSAASSSSFMGLFSTQVMKGKRHSIFVANIPFHIGDEEFSNLVAQHVGDQT